MVRLLRAEGHAGGKHRLGHAATARDAQAAVVIQPSACAFFGPDPRTECQRDGDVKRAFKVTAIKFSASAKAKIEQAGGQVIQA